MFGPNAAVGMVLPVPGFCPCQARRERRASKHLMEYFTRYSELGVTSCGIELADGAEQSTFA
jgi:hypothetical protein